MVVSEDLIYTGVLVKKTVSVVFRHIYSVKSEECVVVTAEGKESSGRVSDSPQILYS